MDNVYKVENFLLPEELAAIEFILTDENQWPIRSEKKHDGRLGRVIYTIGLSLEIRKNIKQRVEDILGKKIEADLELTFADYDSQYGEPVLPPHFDGDNNAVIVDYQYKSNTSWGFAVNTTVFDMKDNDAVIFNPNEYPHWRPRKVFKDGEFVRMIFMRFPSANIDYTHMGQISSHPMLEQAHKTRDNLI